MTDTLLLVLSEDAYLGDAQVSVWVDGLPAQQFTIKAANSVGRAEPFEMVGSWGPAAHTVSVMFLNDAYGGTPETDRNAYVKGVTWNGVFVPFNASLMSQYQAATVAIPAGTGYPAASPPAGTPTLHITNWTGFKTTSNGDTGSWANSIFPGGNRVLNPADEQEYYCDPTAGDPNPFSVNAAGQLVITATPGPIHGRGYISGALTSIGFFNQQYGSFRAMMQICAGPGWRPAWWFLPSSQVYSSELDAAEWWQADVNHVHQTVLGEIAGGPWRAQDTTPVVLPDADSALHEYRVDWREDFVTFCVDGLQTGQFTTPDGMKEPMAMIFNLAVGTAGSWCGVPNAGAVGTFTIGEVTVYA